MGHDPSLSTWEHGIIWFSLILPCWTLCTHATDVVVLLFQLLHGGKRDRSCHASHPMLEAEESGSGLWSYKGVGWDSSGRGCPLVVTAKEKAKTKDQLEARLQYFLLQLILGSREDQQIWYMYIQDIAELICRLLTSMLTLICYIHVARACSMRLDTLAPRFFLYMLI